MKQFYLFIAIVFYVVSIAFAQSADDFVHVKGNVYYFKNGSYNSLVVTTSEGTVVVDPLNDRAATRLKDNLLLITNQPVSHLIFSHSHMDHASGGSVYKDTASYLAHANAPDSIDGVTPDIRFDDEYSFTLGDNAITLTYLGPGHGEDLIATVVQPENVVFIVDIAAPERMFYSNFAGADVDDWHQQLKKAETLEFDIFVPGHGRVGNHQDLTTSRLYMEDLRALVLAGLKEGKSADQLVSELTFKDRSHWQQYDAWRAGNVSGMANYLIRNDKVE